MQAAIAIPPREETCRCWSQLKSCARLFSRSVNSRSWVAWSITPCSSDLVRLARLSLAILMLVSSRSCSSRDVLFSALGTTASKAAMTNKAAKMKNIVIPMSRLLNAYWLYKSRETGIGFATIHVGLLGWHATTGLYEAVRQQIYYQAHLVRWLALSVFQQ